MSGLGALGRLVDGALAAARQRSRLARLARMHGPLPRDFVPRRYRLLHPDLDGRSDAFVAEHYLVHGRPEGRPHAVEPPGLALALARLRGTPEAGAEADFRAYLERAGLERGLWLRRVEPEAFWAANRSWLDQSPASVAETLSVFVEEGLRRLAPLRPGDAFDADFRRLLGGTGRADPVELYRDWLNAGLEHGEAPNEPRFIEAATGLTAFPTCFDEAAYRAALTPAERPAPGRASALVHLAEVGLPRGVTAGLVGTGTLALLESIARHHLSGGRPAAALAALDATATFGTLSAAGLETKGDALQALGRGPEAARDYAAAADAPGASVRSHLRAAALLAEFGDPEAGLRRLVASATDHAGSPQWRAAARRIVADLFEADRAAASRLREGGDTDAASALLEAAFRRCLDVLPAIDPLPPRLPPGRAGTVVLLADSGGERDRAAEQRRRELTEAGWYADLRDAAHLEPLSRAIYWAQALLVAAAASAPVAHGLLTARALGIPVVFDPAPDDVGLLLGEAMPNPDRATLLQLAAGLCDFALAPTEAVARVVAPLTRSGRCCLVPHGVDPAGLAFLERPWLPLSPTGPTVFCRLVPGQRQGFDAGPGPALARALARHPSLRAVFEGEAPGSAFAPFADRVRALVSIGGEAGWECLAGSDLCLDASTPAGEMLASPRLDAAACGVPSLVAAALAERHDLGPGEGVLAASATSWDEALERLLTDPALRRDLGAKARAAFLAGRRSAATVEALRAILDESGGPALPDGARRRVLVVRDRPADSAWIEALAAEVGDGFAVDAAVADPDSGAGSIRIIDRAGAALLRIGTEGATPVPAGDAVFGPLMARVLDRLRPDLLDVRGAGVLALAAIEAARAAAIPYLAAPDTDWASVARTGALDGALAEIGPRRDLARSLLGAQARPDEAASRRALYHWVLSAKDDPRGTIDAANALRDAGNFAEAERAYEQILAVDPRYHFAHYELAVSRMLRRDHAGALAAINRLLAFAPRDERARHLAARLLHRLGGHGSARALLEGLDDPEAVVLREFGAFVERFPFDWALARCAVMEAAPNYVRAEGLLALARDALHHRAGFSMIRLGDGEGAFLATDPQDNAEFARLHRANQADRARVWFGDGVDIDGNGFVAQARRIGELVARTDVVGIPYSGRIHLEYGHISLPGVTAMVDILRAVERDLAPGAHLCSHDIHFELNEAGLLDLIAEQHRIGVVACHAALPGALARRFGVEVDFHKIPGEKLMAAEIGAEATAGEHFPTVFRAVMQALDRPLAGELFLVSGGLLGKFYCDRIRSSGGVALDIGSLVDAWLGYQTRPGIPVEQMRL